MALLGGVADQIARFVVFVVLLMQVLRNEVRDDHHGTKVVENVWDQIRQTALR